MKRFVPLFLPLLLLITLAAGPAQAQAGLSATYSADVRFPEAITFNLEAEGAADINDIFLRYRVDMITTVEATSVVQIEFEPATAIDISWTWEMRKLLGSLPPGTEVHYSWRIEDASGGKLETPWATVKFNDERHVWKSLTESDVTLFWYTGEQPFAQTLLDAAHEALERLARDVGVELDQAVEIYIYASQYDLLEAMIYPQEWMGGAAFPDYGIIAIGVAPHELEWGKRAISHEIAHMVIYQIVYNPYNDIPTWLDEGLALYAEGELRADIKAALDAAISRDSLISVQTISSSFPSDYNEALLSYAESYSVVEFLIQEYGKEEILLLLDIFKRGSTYDDALLEVYGFDTAGLDDLWRLSLGLEPRQPTQTAVPQVTATPTPDGALFSCQGTTDENRRDGLTVLVITGILLMPGISEVIRLRVRRNNR